jgi:DnaK suppressor protein
MATTRRLAANREAHLRTMLETRRNQLTSDVQGRIRDVVTRSSADRESSTDHEGAESNIQGDIELALIQLKSQTLRRIDAALRRLDQGTYGTCVECHGAISKERLHALPFAARCTNCEEARETTELRRPSAQHWGYDPLTLHLPD